MEGQYKSRFGIRDPILGEAFSEQEERDGSHSIHDRNSELQKFEQFEQFPPLHCNPIHAIKHGVGR